MVYRFFIIVIAFSFLEGCAVHRTQMDNHYNIDSDIVYWKKWSRLGKRFQSERVFSADSKTFKSIPGAKWSADKYATDSKNVYLEGIPIPFAKPSSLKFVAKNYFLDESSVFYQSNKLEGLNPKTLRVLKDKHFVNSYVISGSKAAIDAHVFEVCDVTTFKIREEYTGVWSSDRLCAFHEGKQLRSADIGSLELINYHFAKDKNQVYFHENILKEANPESFELITNKSRGKLAVATDGGRCWNRSGEEVACHQKTQSKGKPIVNMSDKEISEMAVRIAAGWSENRALSKKQILRVEKYTRQALLEKNEGNILTKDQISLINLGELPIGFSYTMNSSVKNPVGENTKLTYILTNKKDGKLFFDVFHNKMHGVLEEIRGINGGVTQKAIPSAYLPTTYKYSDQACVFVTTEICDEDIQAIRGGKRTGHSLQQRLKTEYENGVWTKWQSNKAGSMEIKERAIYDKFGLPLYIISYNADGLKDELKRQD